MPEKIDSLKLEDQIEHNMVWECIGLPRERSVLLRGIPPDGYGDLEWLARHYGSWIGQFARAAGQLIESMGVAVDQ